MMQFLNRILGHITRAANEPQTFARNLMALLLGSYYIAYYKLFHSNIRIGFPFLAYAPVRITGNGSVSIGKRCAVFKNVFRGLSIVTLSESATVEIKDNCALGGLTIRSRHHIAIGTKTMTAVSLVQDSFFVNEEHMPLLMKNMFGNDQQEIEIGHNVWLGAQSIVLPGAAIGEDSVLAAGACCYHTRINEYSLISGNPSKKPLPIANILRFKGLA